MIHLFTQQMFIEILLVLNSTDEVHAFTKLNILEEGGNEHIRALF